MGFVVINLLILYNAFNFIGGVMNIHRKTLINRADFYFNPPPPGEPDPFTPDKRVTQEATKGMSCWYTVMCWISPNGENQIGRAHV